MHEVVLDDTHDVEAVGHDPGVGKIAPDEAAVGAGKIDANDLHAFAALEPAEESGEIGGAFAGPDIEDPAVLQVAEGGAEALAFVEGVFVDAEITRAVEGKAFGGLAEGELLVDAGDGCLSELLPAGEGPDAGAIVVLLVNGFPEGLGTVASGNDAGQAWEEASAAGDAEEMAGVDDETGGLSEAVEVTDPALVAAFADEPGALAMGTGPRLECLRMLDMDGGRGGLDALKGGVTLQA